ncbi:MAG TPA: VWA domain-containing protein [Gemmataceae bacterium]|nr:VWA domain-containing protein [Gemmataceae bacterium]
MNWLPFAFVEAPLAVAAVAGGAVSIPIIIHLLNRRRFKVVTWAAMRFLLAAQKKNSRRMRLEQLLLLAVRCLMVLLLVLAMASVTGWAETVWRAFAPNGGLALASSGQRTHKILVIDSSFSMGLKNGDGNCFERARALAAQIVRESSGGDGFSVVLMAAPPRRIVPEPSEDARKVIAEIERLHLTHGNADLAGTLNTVESLVRASPGKYPTREVYFLTDLQQSTWIARQPALLSATLQKIKDRAQTIFVDVGREGVGNLAVTNLVLDESMAGTGHKTPIIATLTNYGETRTDVSVRLFVGRAKTAATDKVLDLHEVTESTVKQVKRGEAMPVTFAYKFPAPGDYVLVVQVAHDDLEVDDMRSAVVTVKNTVPVMLVNGKPAVEAFDRASEWLRVALNPYDEGGTPTSVAARTKVLSQSQFADEGLGDLTPYDCVFLCDVPRFSLAEVRRLESHVRRGGSVVFCLGPQVDRGSYNDMLYRDGKGLLPARLTDYVQANGRYNFQLAMDPDADREDPLKPFRSEEAREYLLASRFREFIQTEPAARAGPRRILSFVPVPIPGATKTQRGGAAQASIPPGGPAILEWRPPAGKEPGAGRLRGRVVLITTTVNSDWNNWPTSPSFPPLMHELLFYASAARLREQVVQVGEPIELYLPNTSGGAEAVISTPDGRTETIRTQNQDEASVLRWTDTDISGIYSVVVGQHPQQHLFAVNVPALNEAQQLSESDLTRTSREDLQKAYPEWEVQVVTEPGQARHAPPAEGEPEHVLQPLGDVVARWLFLALFALILAEVVLAWHFGHYSAGVMPLEESTQPRPRTKAQWALLVLPWLLFACVLGIAGVLLHNALTDDFLAFLPDTGRRFLERVADIPAPAPGEGSHWRLEYRWFFWDNRADPWLAALAALGAAALVYAIYIREGSQTLRRQDMGGRFLRLGLRMGLVFLMLAVLMPRDRVWFERQSWPDIVILIDDSQSMSTVDQYKDTRIKSVVDRLAQHDGLTKADRLSLAQALVTRGDPDWITAMLTQRKVRVHVYHCSGRAHRLKDVTAFNEVGPAVEAINSLQAEPKNDSSQLGMAVRQVLNDFRGSSLAAVVMLTDGQTTEGEDLVKVSKYAQQMGVPLYFVGIGDAQEVRDLYLHDLQVADSAYVNDRLNFKVRLTAQGYNRLTVPVVLREKGKDKVLDRKTVQFDGTNKSVEVRLLHQPTEAGEKMYEIEVPGQEEEVATDNNRLQRPVFVHEAREMKVLYVEGYRRWEYHYIKTLLERESNRIKGNKSINLKVLLLEADPDFPAQDRSAIAEFPTKAELNTYDVVILGDVDPQSKYDPKMTEHLKDLADFVRERGGGLLMIAGERYAPFAYKDSPLKDILPIDVIDDKPPEDVEIAESYRPELTPTGRMHPIFQFGSGGEKESDEIWARLKEMYWFADGYQIKRAAEVLVVHPTKTRRGGKEGARPNKKQSALDGHPLVVQQFVGAGRSMFLGFDETWRWNFREDQAHFNQFWIQMVRYLARSRLGRIELRLDRQTSYRRGEPIKMTVRFPDDAPPPSPDLEVKVTVERRNPAKAGDTEVRTVQLSKVDGSRATYETLLTQTPEGDYKFWLTQPTAPNPKPRAECKVVRPPGEMERLRMNQTDMERAADESHGRFYTLADAEHLLDDLPTGTRVTVNAPGPPYVVWNRFPLFVLAVLLLSAEWLLRKQKNLL